MMDEMVYRSRSQTYKTLFSDSSRWDHFIDRRDDVFICTPPKSGTTWTQTICALLLLGWDDFTVNLSDISPWYDATFDTVEQMNFRLNAQQHRRFIKTHTPLDGITYSPNATYIAVYRDPLDVFFSMQNHMKNMNLPAGTALPASSVLFQDWILRPAKVGNKSLFSLEAIVLHYKSFKQYSNLNNIHFFHFTAMKQFPVNTVRQIAEILGVSIDRSGVSSVVHQSSFVNMRANPKQFTPNVDLDLWKKDEDFFASGQNNQWHGILSEEDLSVYSTRLNDLLNANESAWISTGIKT